MIDSTKNDYESLLSSIDFFSQNLHIEQIVEYGFSIFNALENPEASAIYVYNDELVQFEVKFKQGYLIQLPVISKTDRHDDFAVRNGFLLLDREVQMRYFDEHVLDNASISKIMPLITDDKLYGFIISTNGQRGEALSFEFLTRFNYLMNLSLEKASRYLERAQLKREIDKRIFSLNSISHSMRILLSELDIDTILQLSVDVIREITTSSITSIGIYDIVEDVIKIQAYENLLDINSPYEIFKIKDKRVSSGQMVFKYPDEKEKLSDIFFNVSKFDALSPEYVILLVKNQVLGFVTIGKPMVEINYDESLLERIKDIVSIIYISIKNSHQFKTISEQKEQLRLQLSVLNNTSRIIKNINSAESMSELADMMMTTMNLSFGIEAGMLVTFHGEDEQIRGHVGDSVEEMSTLFLESIKQSTTHEIKIHYTLQEIEKEFGSEAIRSYPSMNCYIVAPIYTNQYMKAPMGAVIVTQTRKRLNESQVSMIEMLTNSVGPVMGQLLNLERYENNYMPKPEYEIERLYQQYLMEAEIYTLDFQVYVKRIEMMPFSSIETDCYKKYDHVFIHQMVVIFATEPLDAILFEEVTSVNPGFEEVKSLIMMMAS